MGEAPPPLLRLYPTPAAEQMSAEDAYSDIFLPQASSSADGKPYVAINMVGTLNGRASVGGKASPIGSPLDRTIMRNLRSSVDAVLVGAGTVRAEEMNLGVPEKLAEKRKKKGLPGQPLGVVVAGASELPLSRKLFRSAGSEEVSRLVVIAGGATPEETLLSAVDLGASVLRTRGSTRPEPDHVLRLLAEEFGVRSVLLEGGPAINFSFLAADAVDEMFLTLSPKIFLAVGEDAPAIVNATAPTSSGYEARDLSMSLTSVYCAPGEGELYLRYSTPGFR